MCVLHANECLLIKGKIASCSEHLAVLNLSEFLNKLGWFVRVHLTFLQNSKR